MRRRLVAEGKDGSARRQNDLLVDLDVLEDAVVVAAADLADVVAVSGVLLQVSIMWAEAFTTAQWP